MGRAPGCGFCTVVFFDLDRGCRPLSRNLGAAFGADRGRRDVRWVPVVEFFRVLHSEESKNLLKRKKERDPAITRESTELAGSYSWHLSRRWRIGCAVCGGIAAGDTARRRMVRTLREGNRKTVVGTDGWLIYRPAIDALTGLGPLREEPKSVADDPTTCRRGTGRWNRSWHSGSN